MKTKTIALYARTSTANQKHDSQLREVRAYIKRRWPKAKVCEFIDTASGARTDRKGLESMMVEVRAGRLDVVCAFKLDRLGRSLAHLAQLIGEFERLRVALVVTTQGIDTTDESPAGRLQMNVLAAVAEFERGIIRERVNAGLAAARDRGVKLGRKPTLDKHRAEVSRLMEAGLSGRKIAEELQIPYGSVTKLARDLKVNAG